MPRAFKTALQIIVINIIFSFFNMIKQIRPVIFYFELFKVSFKASKATKFYLFMKLYSC